MSTPDTLPALLRRWADVEPERLGTILYLLNQAQRPINRETFAWEVQGRVQQAIRARGHVIDLRLYPDGEAAVVLWQPDDGEQVAADARPVAEAEGVGAASALLSAYLDALDAQRPT